MEFNRGFHFQPSFNGSSDSFDELLMLSGVGKKVWKISNVCTITTDELGRSLHFVEVADEDEFEDE